jgi:iron(II)-dependent oxidoreductase
MGVSQAIDPQREELCTALAAVRERTLALVAPLSPADLERQIDPILSPLVWDLAHIAAYEDLWLVHRHADLPLLHGDLAATYDAFETPRAVRGDIQLLDTAGALAYMDDVRERTLTAIDRHGADPVIHGMVLRHEQQHAETMLQTLSRARLPGYDVPGRTPAPGAPGGHSGLEFVPVAGGEVSIGAAPGAFSFDNERPRHSVEVAPFRIGRTPVTNATWLTFTEGGGYERREWWSEEAWAWKQEYDISRPLCWERRSGGWVEHTLHGTRDLDPDRPAAHVSWFEAAAVARANGARLPTEAEWETAATWTRPAGTGDANLMPGTFGTTPVGTFPGGAADCGALDLIGNLWEWTSTEFDGYPGFVAHPYREYSEVFFAAGMRVLRGGSWATQSDVASRTFRNWDLPQRRQIFCGVRLATDEEQP